jgi:DNA-binding beta-propeller fold protein YncE
VFNRGDGALLRRFGCEGGGDGELSDPRGLCFMADGRHVAVAESENHRVSVFSVGGDFIRHVGVGALTSPCAVACSAFDELVVTDADRSLYGRGRVVVFTAGGEVAATLGVSGFDIHGAALHDGAIFVRSSSRDGNKGVVFTLV